MTTVKSALLRKGRAVPCERYLLMIILCSVEHAGCVGKAGVIQFAQLLLLPQHFCVLQLRDRSLRDQDERLTSRDIT